ncbi:aromatic ring-hydroxylating dioxygenase subunit alpha [Zhongshania sp.]|jgi:phenylpropionate dioxygenase-like ring-hydroxylating dioxygenase large terminal subunit|uniref:Aromatic ring-hydroxylating dioxygenase subunit alpha n=1 Tax=Zhongshania guokunii TaxID=641783 RepID=A0ABV3UCS9_9GAMM|nr:aromatic ring-hydroxylating dioxygenase subunit alpha [Zhongshania sp.]MBQ0796721.1 aromatic ring-hydroxylating dioxygenase subunit alpha [Zhongshania sp.]
MNMTMDNKINANVSDQFTIATDRYTSKDFAEKEQQLLWKRAWLWACREEELPNAGDVVTFDIVGQSVLLIRQKDMSVKAFHNVCPHRGRQLLQDSAHLSHVSCPFHSWQWNLDGSIKRVLDREDWQGCEHMQDADLKLKEVHVGFWGGFIFINLDEGCQPFEDFIKPVPEYLNVLGFENMQYCWHKTVVLNCNWKVAQEAFMESYHVMGVHPQFLPYVDESNFSQSQGIHGHHVYTWERPPGSPSRRTGRDMPEDYRSAIINFFKTFDQVADKTRNGQQSKRSMDAGIKAIEGLPAGLDHMEIMMAAVTSMYEAAQAEGAFFPLVDPETAAKIGVDWNVFPNMSLVFGYDGTLVMRARPHDSDPNYCTLDLCAIIAWGKGKAPKVEKERYENWRANSDDIPMLLLQDVKNMEEVQKGMHSDGIDILRPNPVQEQQIIHFHSVIDSYLSAEK